MIQYIKTRQTYNSFTVLADLSARHLQQYCACLTYALKRQQLPQLNG